MFGIFKKKSGSRKPRGAHMTWARSSMSRSMSRTGTFLKKQLWIWPIIAVFVLMIVGLTVQRAIESTMRENIDSDLKTLLAVETAMLENWYSVQESNAQSLANDTQVRDAILALVEAKSPGVPIEMAGFEKLQDELRRELGPGMSSHDYTGFFIATKNDEILSSSFPDLIGKQNIAAYDRMLSRTLDGQTVVTPPFESVAISKDANGQYRTGVPTMYVVAPVRDAGFQVIAALALQIRPDREFTRILQLGRSGDSGETYAFNSKALMVSNSRFDSDLILLGLLPDKDDSRSILNILIHDPGGDITKGHRAMVRRHELPMTKMAASATAGNTSSTVDGYNDYRGVPVVGAWTWLDKYEIGITSEIDHEEAFRPLTILQWTFGVLFMLLVFSSIAIFIFTMIVSRLQKEAQKAAVEAQQLGQYKLKNKLGAGAMGIVYRGEHAMLQRPTAIKLLHIDKVNEDTIKRFEREVQMTCQLNNPHTIAIYDYGRTPEGVFYYAMEYLDGIDLQQLVDDYGPVSEARAIHILEQVCESLFEAHSLGLVHRDIKPANIMVNQRGAMPDVVKVLDFGLVKALDEKKESGLTVANSLTGTPLYMSPEAIQSPDLVDARSDIYALGAVAYFLITGKPLFDAENIVELCQKHVAEKPTPISQLTSSVISIETEATLLACLEKDRNKRPLSAREIITRIKQSSAYQKWTVEEAELWWESHKTGNIKKPDAISDTQPPQHDQTIVESS